MKKKLNRKYEKESHDVQARKEVTDAQTQVFHSEVNISDDVIATIVNITVKEVEGVHTLQDSLPNMIIKNKNTQGVKIVRLVEKEAQHAGDFKVDIHINLVVDFGTKIMEACNKIQNDVKNSVENMSGIEVNNIHINVVGVYSPKVANVSGL